MKIVIWGYPLHSHTHSYIHEAFYRTFKYLGYDTYWFDDNNYPKDFNWDNCLFWTEGFADKNIPLNKTSIYFVHVCPDPKKYLQNEVKKFIDVRYNNIWHNDHCYDYSLNKSSVEKIGKCVYWQKPIIGNIVVKNDYHNYEIKDYDKIYISWASNFLPEQFNFDDIKIERKNIINFCGTLSKNGRCENYSTFQPFIKACNDNNIKFNHNNPFSNPLPEDEVIRLTKESILGVDIRGPEHIKNGYVPCRLFKSISYGHLGMTNSIEAYNELEGNCIYEEDTEKLFYTSMQRKNDISFIKNAMVYVKENHTFINRIQSIMKEGLI